jgi:hypothetical protein
MLFLSSSYSDQTISGTCHGASVLIVSFVLGAFLYKLIFCFCVFQSYLCCNFHLIHKIKFTPLYNRLKLSRVLFDYHGTNFKNHGVAVLGYSKKLGCT